MNLPPKYPGHFDDVEPHSSISEVNHTRYQIQKVKQPTKSFQDVDSVPTEPFDYMSLFNQNVSSQPIISMNQIYEDEDEDSSYSYQQVVQNKAEQQDAKVPPCKQPAKVVITSLPNKPQNLVLQQNVLSKCSGKGCLGYGALTNAQIISANQVTIDPSVDLVIITAASPSTILLPHISSQDDILLKSTLTQLKSLTIKNYSLATHVLKAVDESKVDKVLGSVKLEPGSKKQLVAAGNTWINI